MNEGIHSQDPLQDTSHTHILQLYRRILDSIPDAIVVHQEGIIQFANQGAVQLMALPDHVNPIDMEIWSFFHPSTLEQVQNEFQKLSSNSEIGNSTPTTQHTIVRYDGTVFTGEIRSILINDGNPPVIMSLTRDVSVENELKSKLEHIAYHDALTGLPNRRYFTENLNRLLRAPSTNTRNHAVLFLDMDRFKNINDTYGHEFGDEALSVMGLRLESMLPADCFLARIGGDEFAVVCSNVSQRNKVLVLAEQILQAFAVPLIVRGHEFNITPSIGIALYPDWGTDIDSLVKHADLAMYSAKRSGGNKIHVYVPEESSAIEERLRIEHGIRLGLEEKEFILHFQPKVNLDSGKIHSVEALIRWKTPDGEIMPPGKFIPVAEESGLIASIGQWVLLAACRQNKQWQLQGYSPMVVSVNVSPKQFQLTNMEQTIRHVLDETGLSPKWLEIEITEGLLMQDSSEIADVLQSIRKMGVKISIDDFGTGYSSLKYLRIFEPSTLKIDQCFVANMMEDSGHMSIVSVIIHLAHNLKMEAVAEGVESAAQLSRLQEEGCRLAQGFFFSQPVFPEEIEQKWLQTTFNAL